MYQLTEYLLVIAANIGTQINAGEVILMDVFLKWRFAEQMSKGLFQQFDAVFIRGQDSEITALRVNQSLRIDDHADEMIWTFLTAVDLFEPNTDTRIGIFRANVVSPALIVRVNNMIAGLNLLFVQMLFALVPHRLTQFDRQFNSVYGEPIRLPTDLDILTAFDFL